MFKKINIFLAVFFIASFFSTATASNTVTTLGNPLRVGSFQLLIGSVIDKVLGVVGALALVMFVFGGITWMTAMGNDQQITKGKNVLMWAAIGLVVIFSSYALIRFILSAMGV